MPVRRLRSFEAMGDRWREPGSPELFRAIAAVWRLGSETQQLRFPPGVYKHRSIEELNRLTETWQEANFRRFHERRAAASVAPTGANPR